MARRTVTVLTDDLDGNKAEESITFGLDGIQYEIDLSTKNAGKLRKALEPYVFNGTRIGRRGVAARRGRPTSAASVKDRELNKAIREWAQKSGKKLADRGRIPQTIVDEYLSTH